MFSRVCFALMFTSLMFVTTPVVVQAGKVDATPGRDYRITKEHGPWMIFVASFHRPGVDRPDAVEKDGGDETVAREAAKTLVLELRQKGIPAYVFELQKERETVLTRNRRGEQQVRKTQADDVQISVMAGNYNSLNDEVAVKTLEWVKRYNPPSFQGKARYRVSPGRQGPLAGAFLTMNPLLSRSEVLARTVDPEQDKLLRRLNAGNEFPVTKCGGEYTLIIKTFDGRSGMKSNAHVSKDFSLLDSGTFLGKAGYDAWELAASLRNRGIEAHVWHEQFRSVVTIGGFDGPTDPALKTMQKRYGATMGKDKNGQPKMIYKTEPPMNVLMSQGGDKYWVFDTKPEPMKVPKLQKKRGLFISAK